MQKPLVHAFFDPHTNTISYIVADEETKDAVIIDSVLDYESASGKISYENAKKIIEKVHYEKYTVRYILETHAHADHLTAAQYLKKELGGVVAIGENIIAVQKTFANAFNLPNLPTDGSQFDRLWKHQETFSVGSLTATVLEVPGHTPADVAYLIGDALFVGDTLFMPDYGTARCDFPGGSAETLYESIQSIYRLPRETRMFLCHDYLPETRTTYIWETNVEEQQEYNIHVNTLTNQEHFVRMRKERDEKLTMPKLIIPALQINIRAGHLPEKEENGISYLKIPLNGAFSK